jgi:hypothetical protein
MIFGIAEASSLVWLCQLLHTAHVIIENVIVLYLQ